MSEPSSPGGQSRIPVGVSSCLMGARVRYDGGHKGHSYIMQTLAEYFEFRQFCPELEIGMTVPRTPLSLTRGQSGVIRCIALDDDAVDYTDKLRCCADEQRSWHDGLCGYIVKQASPSCGMTGVRVRGERGGEGLPIGDGVGIYVARLMENYPQLPVEEEGSLGDALLRQNFIQRVFVARRWQQLLAAGLTVASLVEFHGRHRLIIMSHDQVTFRKLDQLVAAASAENLADSARQYLYRLMVALKTPARRANHVLVLQFILSHLEAELDDDDRQELLEAIEAYRRHQSPLLVAVTLLNHFLRRHPQPSLANSWYMRPDAAELRLCSSG